MINIRLNVLRLLDDDTITSIQRSCTRRSFHMGKNQSWRMANTDTTACVRDLSTTHLKATARNCQFCTVSKRYPVKRGCHSMRWAEQTLGQRVRNVKTMKMTTCENNCNAPSACKAEELARSRI